METKNATLGSTGVSSQQFVSFVREMLGGSPKREGPITTSRWDPLIRAALEQMNPPFSSLYPFDDGPWWPHPKPNWRQRYTDYGPLPETWHHAFPLPWMQTNAMVSALNPQPLPPILLFAALLANQVIADIIYRQELADIIGKNDGEHAVSRLKFFIDDCGTWYHKWPHPGPPPPWWMQELLGSQLVVIGVQLETAAGLTLNESLQKTFTGGGAHLIKAGIERMGAV
ncbi:hypothetical protein ACE38W_17750 [Chitinophaga sp. Hz27]|uniref:hypothetical protein n=1 Tax=Chitinophaga sp. Hz27 TaxID=3347169 RepID=UPI0035E0C477